MPAALLLEGAIDTTLFARAFELLVERHGSACEPPSGSASQAGRVRSFIRAQTRAEVIDLSEFPDSEARARRAGGRGRDASLRLPLSVVR